MRISSFRTWEAFPRPRPRTGSSPPSAITTGRLPARNPIRTTSPCRGTSGYYEFTRSLVHFFVIDSDSHEPDGIFATSTQGQWLQARLAASTLKYRFVVMHHAPFSSGPNGSLAAVQWPYRAWGASAVLAGHDHTYERIVRDGLTYVVNGAGGFGLYSFGPPVAGSLVRYNADHGALLVEVSPGSANFKFVNRGGNVVDSFSVAPAK